MAEVTMTFNGESRPYLRVLHDLKRSSWAPITRELLQVPGVAGAYLTGTRTEVREITVPVMLVGTSYEDLQTLKEDLAAWLVHDEAKELTFSDEPNRTYYALIEGGFEAEDIIKHGKGTLRFVCPDPYKYGDEVTVNWPASLSAQTDFTGKVAGSTVENPHIGKTAGLTFVGVPSPSEASHEITDSNYSRVKTLDGSTLSATRTNYGSAGNLVFSFDLISYIEREYGYPLPGGSTAEKVAWLKANVSSITANWWGKGTNKQANPTGTANFVGKVAGSTVENPHYAHSRISTNLGNPATMSENFTNARYADLATLNGSSTFTSNSTNGNLVAHMFSFNLIEYVQRKYNVTIPGETTADKVQWLKDNLSKLTCRWYGFGSGPSGNVANISYWHGSGWSAYTSHSNGVVTLLTRGVNLNLDIVDSNGFFHFNAHAEASDGTTASTINTDYVELEVELKAGEDKANFTAWNGSAWNSPVVHAGNAIGLKSYSPGTIPLYIDSDGFSHFLAYAEPSNGISPSTIETDYVELLVNFRASQLPITIDNTGSADALPTINLEVTKNVTFAMAQKGVSDYQLIGEPVEVVQTPVDTRTLLLSEDGSTIGSWTAVTPGMGSSEGTIGYDGAGITAPNYGSGTSYHGPNYYKQVSLTGDFEIELRGQLLSGIPETGRLGFQLFDDQVRPIAMMNVVDIIRTMHRKSAEARVGGYVGDFVNYPISSRNYRYEWENFPCYLRVRRIGSTFEFYVARVLGDGTHMNPLTQLWTVTDSAYLGQLKYVTIFLEKHGTSPSPHTNRIYYIKAWALGQATSDQTPYIAYAGDIITFDHAGRRILINGFDRTDLKAFGGKYFKLDPGTNVITPYPESSFNATITYRERFK